MNQFSPMSQSHVMAAFGVPTAGRSWTDSKLTLARRAHPCQLCCVQIQPGEEQLAYAQGRRSWLYMHVACARARGYACKVLEQPDQPGDEHVVPRK